MASASRMYKTNFEQFEVRQAKFIFKFDGKLKYKNDEE